jgi:hypothetical protein
MKEHIWPSNWNEFKCVGFYMEYVMYFWAMRYGIGARDTIMQMEI